MPRYSPGFAGEGVSNESAVVENASFLLQSLYLPYEVPRWLYIGPYRNLHGFARFPCDSTAVLISDNFEHMGLNTICIEATYTIIIYAEFLFLPNRLSQTSVKDVLEILPHDVGVALLAKSKYWHI